jgi:hypothetical protein
VATAALIAVGVLSLLVFVLFGAVLESLRDVRQMRDALGILDRPLEVNIGAAAGTAPSSHGLPRQLDEARAALVLFLSDKCATCRILAATLGDALPASLWVVVEAASNRAAAEFVEAYGMKPRLEDGRVTVDPAGVIAGRLGLNTTPVAFRIENGVFKDAATVPSIRYLSSVIPGPSEAASDFRRGRRRLMPSNVRIQDHPKLDPVLPDREKVVH